MSAAVAVTKDGRTQADNREVFGFAQSQALEDEGSENAGLKDQRLSIEWTRDNIAFFGGDPEKITIYGQSSGGKPLLQHAATKNA